MYVQKGKYKIISDEKESEWKDGDPDKPDQEKGDWNPQKEKPIQKERKSVKDKVKEIVNNAANRGMGSGGGSGALRKFVERLANPQINWRKILQRYVSTANEEPTMYKIPNRRYASQGIYLPGLRGKEEGFGSVVIAVDTSGSIGSEEYNTFLTEARSKKGKDLACLIYFTDGGAHDPEKPKWHKKIIWAMISSKQMPFGKHVNVPMKELKRKK